MHVRGTFEITMKPEPPYSTQDGVTLGRFHFDKIFAGALVGTSTVEMTAARTPVPTSAAYVAVERFDVTLDGKRGTFVATHLGVMQGGAQTLAVSLVPDSGTGELRGISGSMKIDVIDGQHFYEFTYELSPR